jgi:acyl carrier protein
MDDLKQRLTNCFAAVFPELSEEEIHRASQVSISNWDSVASITLVNVIEEEFDIQIDLEAVADLVSFDLVLDYLNGRNAATAPGL